MICDMELSLGDEINDGIAVDLGAGGGVEANYRILPIHPLSPLSASLDDVPRARDMRKKTA